MYGIMLDVDGLTSWLDFSILLIPEVRLFYQVLAETKAIRESNKKKLPSVRFSITLLVYLMQFPN